MERNRWVADGSKPNQTQFGAVGRNGDWRRQTKPIAAGVLSAVERIFRRFLARNRIGAEEQTQSGHLGRSRLRIGTLATNPQSAIANPQWAGLAGTAGIVYNAGSFG